ncbi:MAG: EAL domain-containing protein, partial [Actinobacteria bacterium]|nr:EAL domain-containing protein [Actinomycetota bacterium]
RADVAMYQAKVSRSGPMLYDAAQDEFSRPRLRLAEDLRKGIADGQLRLVYQPQVDTASQEVQGLEALVRWEHPTQGELQPFKFLPAARRAGLMSSLSEEIARIAISDLSDWHKAGLPVRVAINCAPPELLSGVFVTRLYALLAERPEVLEHLVVELTEDSFLSEPERAREIIEDMRGRKLQIAIDDYGTGYSSLSYLRDLPVQELKIDRSFVSAIRSDRRTRMIVASTVQMAAALELRTVAEGVEDAATAADLVSLGVDVLQGYHLARPMPAGDVETWLRSWAATPRLPLSRGRTDELARWREARPSGPRAAARHRPARLDAGP